MTNKIAALETNEIQSISGGGSVFRGYIYECVCAPKKGDIPQNQKRFTTCNTYIAAIGRCLYLCGGSFGMSNTGKRC